MAQVVGPLIDTVLRRVRDPAGMATSRAFALALMSRLQRVINTKMKSVLVTETLNTEANRLIYPIAASLPNSAMIVKVRDGGDLDQEMNWRLLANYRRGWFREVGQQHRLFSLIGRDQLVVYPAKDANSTVSVLSVKLTTAFVNDDSVTEIPDSHINSLLNLTEAVILLKSRRLSQVKELVSMAASRLGINVKG